MSLNAPIFSRFIENCFQNLAEYVKCGPIIPKLALERLLKLKCIDYLLSFKLLTHLCINLFTQNPRNFGFMHEAVLGKNQIKCF